MDSKHTLMRKRLQDSWMDLYKTVNTDSPSWGADLASLRAKLDANRQGMPQQVTDKVRLVNEIKREIHKQKFHFTDNLFSLMFIVASELSEQQRSQLTSHMAPRNVSIKDCTWQSVDLTKEYKLQIRSCF